MDKTKLQQANSLNEAIDQLDSVIDAITEKLRSSKGDLAIVTSEHEPSHYLTLDNLNISIVVCALLETLKAERTELQKQFNEL